LNAHSERKTVSAESFLNINPHAEYDLILINWVLHHLVGNSLPATLQLIRSATEIAARALKPGGVIVVSENLVQSTFSERFASAALFKVTGSRLLKPVISRMRDGTAIAGVGIYYLSEPQLHAMFPGFEPIATFDQGQHNYGWKLKLIGVTRVMEKILVFQKIA
jgi:SAM-dependent methyltransferase